MFVTNEITATYYRLTKRGLTFPTTSISSQSQRKSIATEVLKARLGWVGRYGQDAGQRPPKRRTKGLTFTKLRLLTYFLKVKSLAIAQLTLSRHTSSELDSALDRVNLGWLCEGSMILSLTFCYF